MTADEKEGHGIVRASEFRENGRLRRFFPRCSLGSEITALCAAGRLITGSRPRDLDTNKYKEVGSWFRRSYDDITRCRTRYDAKRRIPLGWKMPRHETTR